MALRQALGVGLGQKIPNYCQRTNAPTHKSPLDHPIKSCYLPIC
jgi:hypothetical protein